MSTPLPIEKAEQQFTGFAHAYHGFDVISLVESMGLQADEWEQVKADMPWLSEKIVNEVDDYFEKKDEKPS